jgi:hypothetical protein
MFINREFFHGHSAYRGMGKGKFGMVRRAAVVAYFKILSQH